MLRDIVVGGARIAHKVAARDDDREARDLLARCDLAERAGQRLTALTRTVATCASAWLVNFISAV